MRLSMSWLTSPGWPGASRLLTRCCKTASSAPSFSQPRETWAVRCSVRRQAWVEPIAKSLPRQGKANTVEGGRRLTEFLGELARFELSRPTMAKPALLAHSMGSVVLQHAVQDAAWPTGAPLFSQVVLSQPDADDIGHIEWLGKVGAREKVFSTQNADDKVLKQSTDARPAGAHALGLGTSEPLAQNVKYVDLTSMGALGATDDDHEVFGKGAMNGQVNVCAFFEQALLGKTVTMDDSNVASIAREVVYTLKQRSDAHSPCLRIPALPEFAD